jgi:DNA-binding transcriptional LysR family regulator
LTCSRAKPAVDAYPRTIALRCSNESTSSTLLNPSRRTLFTSRAGEHLQLVLSDQPEPEGRDYGVVSLATWRVGDLSLKHKLLLRGMGWGGMPEPMVRSDIEAGRLVRLHLRDWGGGDYPMQVVHKIETPPGLAGRWLIERLVLSLPPYAGTTQSRTASIGEVGPTSRETAA